VLDRVLSGEGDESWMDEEHPADEEFEISAEGGEVEYLQEYVGRYFHLYM